MLRFVVMTPTLNSLHQHACANARALNAIRCVGGKTSALLFPKDPSGRPLGSA
jgi:hypothetical protein